MSFSFLAMIEEKFAEIIARHSLELVFSSSTGRWVRILFANETRGLAIQWEPPDGYIDVQFGVIPRRLPGTSMVWGLTHHFSSLRFLLHERGIEIPAGMHIYRPPDLEAVIDEFVREVGNREEVIFGIST